MRSRSLLWLLALPGLSRAATVAVAASNFQFSPRTVTVNVGDTVQWSGLGFGHNASQSNGPSDTGYNGSGFTSGSTGSGIPTFSFTFNGAGAFYYVCDAHAGAFDMRGLVIVAAPSPTPTPCATPTESPSPSASPSVTLSPTLTPTPNPSFSVTDSPTPTQSFTVCPSPSATPSASATATLSPTASPSPVLSATPSPTMPALSFAGVEEARLLASPITDGLLRVWARLDGGAQSAELRVYSGAFTLMLTQPLGPQAPGAAHWTVPLTDIPPQVIWVQLRVQADGRWRNGPVLRSYVLR